MNGMVKLLRPRRQEQRQIVTFLMLPSQAFFVLMAFVFLSLLIPASPAIAQDAQPDEYVLLLAAMAIVDYDQSSEMFYNREGYYELNPVLGNQPSRTDMLAFGAIGIGVVYLASEFLPESIGKLFMDSVVASEKWNIEDNASIMDGKRRRIEGIPLIISIRF